jgi:DNA-binding transcriptional regulator YdaS (Cro superfamily)
MRKRNAPSSIMGRPVELPGPVGELARAVGGTAALSALLGVSARTLQRWAKAAPPRTARILLERIAAEHKLSLFTAHGRRAERGRRTPKRHAKRADSKRPKRGGTVRLPRALGDLARAVGGTGHLAELLGVNRTTVQRWAKGVVVPLVRGALSRLAAEYGLSKRAQIELAHFNEPSAAGRRAARADTAIEIPHAAPAR